MKDFDNLKIAVAGTGYVGLSMATLLSQNHQVTAVDVIPEKVEKINNRVSPIQDEYIEKFFAEKKLNLKATLDGREAYKDADFVTYADTTPLKQDFGFKPSTSLREGLRRFAEWYKGYYEANIYISFRC